MPEYLDRGRCNVGQEGCRGTRTRCRRRARATEPTPRRFVVPYRVALARISARGASIGAEVSRPPGGGSLTGYVLGIGRGGLLPDRRGQGTGAGRSVGGGTGGFVTVRGPAPFTGVSGANGRAWWRGGGGTSRKKMMFQGNSGVGSGVGGSGVGSGVGGSVVGARTVTSCSTESLPAGFETVSRTV